MKRILGLLMAISLLSACQTKEYAKNPTVSVPAVTREEPKNPIDKDLIDWQSFEKRVDKTTATYQEYSQYFASNEKNDLKKRIVVFSLDETQKDLEESLKLALLCNGNFVIMERDKAKYQEALEHIAKDDKNALKALADTWHSHYLLLLGGKEKADTATLYELTDEPKSKPLAVQKETILQAVSEISHSGSQEEWKAEIASVPSAEKRVVIDAGSLDGVKKGDSFKIEGGDSEGEIVIEEVEEKYALAKLQGIETVSPGMKIQEIKN